MRGLDLSELFFEQTVRPILEKHFPVLVYSVALLGQGSEVLDFDTPQSTDHDWGPRLLLFLAEADHPTYRDTIHQLLCQELPREINGFPTDMAFAGDGQAGEATTGEGPVDHSVQILTVRGFVRHLLNWDPSEDLRVVDWLTFTEQHLCSLTRGRVFHDGLGQLEPVREKLHYYPHDVWLYVLAAQWKRIAQEEAMMGRCGQVGDELGSGLVAARLVRDLMRLCFLMERQYAPYIKWFGTAFAQLECSAQLAPIFERILGSHSWHEREECLTDAYGLVATMHNDLGITDPLPAQVSPYYDRPFRVIHADRFVDAIRALITSEEVLSLPDHLGSIDQFVDSTDALHYLDRFKLIYT